MFTYKYCEKSSYFPNTGFLPQTFDECCIAGDNPLGRPNVFTQKKGKFFPGTKSTCYTYWAPMISLATPDPAACSELVIHGNHTNSLSTVTQIFVQTVTGTGTGPVVPCRPLVVAQSGTNTVIDINGANRGSITGGTVFWNNCLTCPAITTYTQAITGCATNTITFFIDPGQAAYNTFAQQIGTALGIIYITGSTGNDGTYTIAYIQSGNFWTGEVTVMLTNAVLLPSGICDGNINWDV